MSKTTHKLLRFCELIRDVEQTMNANDIIILLLVASRPGLTIDDLWRALDRELSASTVSRVVTRMSDKAPNGEVVGHGFLTLVVSDHDARLRQVFLTPKGQKFLRSLEEALA